MILFAFNLKVMVLDRGRRAYIIHKYMKNHNNYFVFVIGSNFLLLKKKISKQGHFGTFKGALDASSKEQFKT